MLFLFDIDGTLILTGGAGLRALERTWNDLYGTPHAAQGISFDGATDPRIVETMFRQNLGRDPLPGEIERVIDRYLEHLPEEVATTTRYEIMPGVERALALLEARGCAIGLATGNVIRGAEIKLRRGDLWRRFAFGGYGSDSADRTQLVGHAIQRGREHLAQRDGLPSSTPRETWVVGDTPRDVAAAHGCGVRVIGVATGRHSSRDLRAVGADVVMETLEELPDWLAD